MSHRILEQQREFFKSGKTLDKAFRSEQLKKLINAIRQYEPRIVEALNKDLHKPLMESYGSEIMQIIGETKYAIKNLSAWMRPHKVPTPIINFFGAGSIEPQPYGVVLIFSVWNYPFLLLLSPLIGAITAGNCAIVKPSELAPHSSACIAALIKEKFPPEYIAVVEGGVDVSKSLLENKFDYIFYTGSSVIGRNVMKAAAEHLTPVTLELGGKNPCIVDKDINLDVAARRIVWGKLYNAGQTCVAPDYVVVHQNVKDRLVTAMGDCIKMFYGPDPFQSADYCRIIDEKHYKRLFDLTRGYKTVTGRQSSEEDRYIAPTIVENVDWNHPLMREEIFGPIFPIIAYEDIDEIIRRITAYPKPLALYIFSADRALQKKLLRQIPSGGCSINDTLSQFVGNYLPAGGVGESGTGRYHGKASFETFSHFKSIFRRSCLVDIPLRYPPYGNKHKVLKMFFC